MSKYEVKSVVCDYGVFEDNELKLICNSHANALKIKEILETDSDMSKPYVWQDKTIADLEAKLAESEKKFIIANNLRKNSDEVLLNYKTEKYGLDKTIQELRKMKLSFPEKEYYYKGFENCERQMSSHIADLTLEVKQLKQQLAEKEEHLKLHKQSNKILNDQLDKATEHISGLNEQLAEKEKEVEELNKFMSDKADEIEDLKERISNKITSAYGAELMARDIQWHLEKEIHELQQSQNQTAIAELKKLKKFAEKNKFVVSDYHNLDLAELNYGICFETLCKQTDQQIKQLKEMK